MWWVVMVALISALLGGCAAVEETCSRDCPAEQKGDDGCCPVVRAAGSGYTKPRDTSRDYTSATAGKLVWVPDVNVWMMEHEVTQGEWQGVMGSNPSFFTACGSDCPVERVSWDQAVAFGQKASARDRVGYRLPTEQEWEAAAKGGEAFEYAGSSDLDAVGWYDGNSAGTTHAVCGKQRNGYGLCDMSGNVREWTATSVGSARVDRGGSWDLTPAYARVAHRCTNDPSNFSNYLGFRLARSGP